MKRLILLLVLAGAAAAFQTPTFTAEVKLVRLLVTVKDKAGGAVGGLNQSDFAVTDSGAQQQIRFFERNTAQPLSIALLIDASGSAVKDFKVETDSVAKFVKALFGSGNPRDTASLYVFNYQVRQLVGFARRANTIIGQLRMVKPEAGTSLYDAIYLTAPDLEVREGRHVMVIVSDGGNTTSIKDFKAALEAAQRADAVIYPIVIIPIKNDAGRNLGGEHALQSLAEDTGGRIFQPMLGQQLDKAFDDILLALRTQYLLGYYPANLPRGTPKFHLVHVDVAGTDLRATTRAGYYGEAVP